MADGAAVGEYVDLAREWTVDELHKMLADHETASGHELQFRRFQLIDRTLLMSPSPDSRHEILVLRLAGQLEQSLPAELTLAASVGVDLDASYLIPDLLAVPVSRFADPIDRLPPDEIPLAIEIVSPSSATMDRVTKPALYAQAGIAHYWRVETRPDVTITAYTLDGDAYREVGTWGPGEIMTLDQPFPLTVSLDELNR